MPFHEKIFLLIARQNRLVVYNNILCISAPNAGARARSPTIERTQTQSRAEQRQQQQQTTQIKYSKQKAHSNYLLHRHLQRERVYDASCFLLFCVWSIVFVLCFYSVFFFGIFLSFPARESA